MSHRLLLSGANARLSADERRYFSEWMTIFSFGLVAITLFTMMGWGQTFGNILYDHFLYWWPVPISNDIVVIAVDDQTIKSQGGWPLNRKEYATLLKILAEEENKPKVIGIDLLFSDSRPEDAMLAEQMRRHNVILAVEHPRNVAHELVPHFASNPLLSNASRTLAHINLSYESDGVVRGANLIEGGMPQLALAMSGKQYDPFDARGSYRRMQFADQDMSFPTASLADVIAGLVPPKFFKDKYVLIGATAPSLGDQFSTPFSGRLHAGSPGVMLHANLLNNILRDRLIVPAPLGVQLLASWIILLCALLSLIVLSPTMEIIASVTIVVIAIITSFAMLMFAHIWFDPGMCIIAIALLKPIWAWRRSEMVLDYMSKRIDRLKGDLVPNPARRTAPGVGRLMKDSLLQYSEVLDRTIETVQDQSQFLERVIEKVPVGIVIADSDGVIIFWNPILRNNFSVELVQKGANVAEFLQYLNLPTLNLKTLLSESDHFVSVQNSHNERQDFVCNVSQVLHLGDDPLWLISLSDITELRQFQVERDRTLQLLSHDMRTPVASIIALSRRPVDGIVSVGQFTASVKQQAIVLLALIDDFILSIYAQAPQYQLGEILLDELVDEAIYQVKDLAMGRNMRLAFDQKNTPQFVMADARLLTRVIVNLLVNAIRYGEPGTEINVLLIHDGSDHSLQSVLCVVSNTVGYSRSASIDDEITGKSHGLGLNFINTVIQKHSGTIRTVFPKTAGAIAFVELILPIAIQPKALKA